MNTERQSLRPQRRSAGGWGCAALLAGTLGASALLIVWARQSPSLQSQSPQSRPLPEGFQAVQAAGFTVLLSPAVQADPDLQERVMWRLEEQLQETLAVLPAQHRAWARQVRIFVDPDGPPNEEATLEPTAIYLAQAAADSAWADQAGSVIIVDLPAFIKVHGRMNLLLHELAHAYDDTQLNFRDAGVTAAFTAARRRSLYVSDTDASFDQYANVNAREYFAELTVSYFASRLFSPRNRAELRTFDPQGYRAIQQAWGVN